MNYDSICYIRMYVHICTYVYLYICNYVCVLVIAYVSVFVLDVILCRIRFFMQISRVCNCSASAPDLCADGTL